MRSSPDRGTQGRKVKRSPDYGPIAATYDQRYRQETFRGVSRLLRSLVDQRRPRTIVEIGCGTGHWLAQMPDDLRVVGIDRSAAMLARAQSKRTRSDLVRADAAALPLAPGSVDLLYCINALHHFPSPERFLHAAGRLVAPTGNILIIGSDPRKAAREWDVYEYFDGVRANDVARFPSSRQIREWLAGAGFEIEAVGTAHPIRQRYVGPEVLRQHFLGRRGTSQMALLTDDAYQAGIARIKATIKRDPKHLFETRIDLDFVLGRRTPRG